MMTQRASLSCRLVLACLWVTLVTLPALAQETKPVADLGNLSELARTGQFDKVEQLLQTQSALAASDPQIASLLTTLQQRHQHVQETSLKRGKAMADALAKMDKAIEARKLDEALFAAVEAHGLSDNPQEFLKDSRVVNLLNLAEWIAVLSERNGDWVEALNLYRIMDLLFEEAPRYRTAMKQAERRVRLLRMYAPEEFRRLLAARADRMGKDAPEPLTTSNETWQQQLAGIDLSMLEETLAIAARGHIFKPGYGQMLQGAADALTTLTQTKSMDVAFPSFKDTAKLDAFRKGLQEIHADIDAQRQNMTGKDAARILERITRLNHDTIDLPESVLSYELCEGATSTLDDFSNVIWPSDTEDFADTLQGSFSGVGIEISKRDGRLIAVSPIEDTPAQRAGIKPGDIITAVNGQDTSRWSVDKAKKEIRGPEGSTVNLTIERTGIKQPLDFKIIRSRIMIVSIKGWEHKAGGGWDYYIDPQQKIGYIRLSNFIPQTADDLDAAINQMQQTQDLQALILDLRFNPGGKLDSAVDVANRFVRTGKLVSVENAAGQTVEQYRAMPHKALRPFPVVVLVNEGSASASEIVSGCLQDYKRGFIIGGRTFGKGSVQHVLSIAGGKAQLKLTVQYYRLPGGRIIHRTPGQTTWGIEPDLSIKMTTQQIADAIEHRRNADILHSPSDPPATQPAVTAAQILEKGLDPQLEAALLYLKTTLIADRIAVAGKTPPTNARP